MPPPASPAAPAPASPASPAPLGAPAVDYPGQERRADPELREAEDELNELFGEDDVREQFAQWARGLDER